MDSARGNFFGTGPYSSASIQSAFGNDIRVSMLLARERKWTVSCFGCDWQSLTAPTHDSRSISNKDTALEASHSALSALLCYRKALCELFRWEQVRVSRLSSET